MRRIALWTAFLALLAGITVTLRPRNSFASFSRSHPFGALAPVAPSGWEVQDTPLGATEFSAGETARTLYFNDFFYKTYTKGEMRVRVYAAYWAPGRLDPSMVASHTPDECWVSAGGTIIVRDDRRVLPSFGKRVFSQAYFRAFQFSQGREEVVFWYSLGGKPNRSMVQGTSPLLAGLRFFGQALSLTRFGFAPREQIFVRISTNRTIDELVTSDLWPELASSLIQIGILEPTS